MVHIEEKVDVTFSEFKWGNTWSARTLPDGTQAWTQTRNGVITNGGLNQTPQVFNPDRPIGTS